MSQPQFPDGPPIPLMVEGTIDAATLRQLFADLATSATVTSVREKGGPTQYACPGGLTPETARDRLLAGAARAVQIRYQFMAGEWTDTIVATAGAFRVVRCRHQ